jgi:hypothetical protein
MLRRFSETAATRRTEQGVSTNAEWQIQLMAEPLFCSGTETYAAGIDRIFAPRQQRKLHSPGGQRRTRPSASLCLSGVSMIEAPNEWESKLPDVETAFMATH